MAIGLRGDGTPDLSTPEKIKTAMLNAKSLRWSDTGAALFTVNKILDTLKIRDAVKAKHDMAAPPVSLGPGEYEINIYPLSEILANTEPAQHGPGHSGAAGAGRGHRYHFDKHPERGSCPERWSRSFRVRRSSRLSREMVSNVEGSFQETGNF